MHFVDKVNVLENLNKDLDYFIKMNGKPEFIVISSWALSQLRREIRSLGKMIFNKKHCFEFKGIPLVVD